MLINKLVITEYSADVKYNVKVKTIREIKKTRRSSYIEKKYAVSVFMNNEQIAQATSTIKSVAFHTATIALLDSDVIKYNIYLQIKMQFPYFYRHWEI